MCLVNGKGRFLTTRSSEIWGATDPKLKTKKHVLGATPHANYGWDRIKGVGGANTQFVTSLVLPVFLFFFCILRSPSRWDRSTDRDA